MINVIVVFAMPHRQYMISVPLKKKSFIYQAVEKSNIRSIFPQIDFSSVIYGIFGQKITNPESYILKDGDRVEIYRKLICNVQEKMQEVQNRRMKNSTISTKLSH